MSTEFRFLPLPPEGRLTPRYAQMWVEEKAAEYVRLLEAGYLVRNPDVRSGFLFLANDVAHMLDACSEALGRGLVVDVARDSDADTTPAELPKLVAALLALEPEDLETCYPALRELADRIAERDATFQVARGEARRHIARRIAQYLSGATAYTEDVGALALRLERTSPERLLAALRTALETAGAADEEEEPEGGHDADEEDE